MEIFDPNLIGDSLNKNTRKILYSTSEKIKDFRSKILDETQKKELRGALLEPQIRASLEIEGMKVRQRHTTEILKIGKMSDEIKHIDHAQEVINLSDTISLIEKRKFDNLSQSLVCDIHKEVQKEILPVDQAGFFRRSGVRVTGATITPPNYQKLPELMVDLAAKLENSEEKDPIVLAVWLHHQLTRIHPFLDGNGRTARMLQDWLLIKDGYFGVGTTEIKNNEYIELLEEADNKEYDEFVSRIANAQDTVIARAIEAVEMHSRTASKMSDLVKKAMKKNEAAQSQEFTQWRFEMKRVTEQFELNCKQLNMDANGTEENDRRALLGCNFRQHDMIDSNLYESIKKKGYASGNAFQVVWYYKGIPFYKTLAYYQRHISNPEFDKDVRSWKKKVGLFFSGFELPGEVEFPTQGIKRHTRDGEIWATMPWPDDVITLREIISHEKKYYRYFSVPKNTSLQITKDTSLETTSDSKHEIWIADEQSAIDIISEYIESVFKKRGIGV